MHLIIIRYLLILLMFVSASKQIVSQEFHYWNTQVGAKSSMLGGAVTAADNDNSAIYYNPGALGFIKNSKISLSSDAYYFSWLRIENGAGKDLDLHSRELNIFPQIIAFNKKVPKLPITVTVAAITKDASFVSTNYKHNKTIDIIKSNPGEEEYVGVVDYYNRLRDTWVGLGYGRKQGENFSIGASVFYSIRSMEYRYTEMADVYKVLADSPNTELIGNVIFSEQMTLRNIGIVILMGLSYQQERLKLGVNLTLPRINLGFFQLSSLTRTYMYNVPSEDSISTKLSLWNEDVSSTFRTPLSIDLGLEYDVSSAITIYSKASWFAPVSKYSLITSEKPENIPPGNVEAVSTAFSNIHLANKAVINIALALQTKVNKQLAVLSSIRTDFNYFDRKALGDLSASYPGITYWDIYHLAGGVVWTKQSFDLSLGASYSFGRDQSSPQIINLSSPSIENDLFGQRDNTARANYNKLSVYFGFTYFFSQF